jgi:hypothetical protein
MKARKVSLFWGDTIRLNKPLIGQLEKGFPQESLGLNDIDPI